MHTPTVANDTLYLSADVARALGVTPQRVRQLAEAGTLPYLRTLRGVRLYRADDVEALREVREAARA